MAKGAISLKILESDRQIQKLILDGYAREINKAINFRRSNIRDRVGKLMPDLIKQTATYESLINGSLAGHFGFEIGTEVGRIEPILRQVEESVSLEFKPFRVRGLKFTGSVRIGIIPLGFKDLLSLPEASFATPENGFIIKWLQWLLLAGDSVLVSTHSIAFVPGLGRSGQAIMVKNSAGSWRIPPFFSGVRTNNWLTRMLIRDSRFIIDEIGTILETEIEKVFS